MPSQSTMIPPPKKDKPLYEAALKYHKAQEKQRRAKALEVEARDGVIAIMKRRRIQTYQHADVTVELVERSTLKVDVGEPAEEE
jgi:hypothetical protein